MKKEGKSEISNEIKSKKNKNCNNTSKESRSTQQSQWHLKLVKKTDISYINWQYL